MLMDDKQPSWDELAAKTWGDIGGEIVKGEVIDGEDVFTQAMGDEMNALRAEVETLKARVDRLESELRQLPVMD